MQPTAARGATAGAGRLATGMSHFTLLLYPDLLEKITLVGFHLRAANNDGKSLGIAALPVNPAPEKNRSIRRLVEASCVCGTLPAVTRGRWNNPESLPVVCRNYPDALQLPLHKPSQNTNKCGNNQKIINRKQKSRLCRFMRRFKRLFSYLLLCHIVMLFALLLVLSDVILGLAKEADDSTFPGKNLLN